MMSASITPIRIHEYRDHPIILHRRRMIEEEVEAYTRNLLLYSLPSFKRELGRSIKVCKDNQPSVIIVESVFSFLNRKELTTVSKVSKQWNRLAMKPHTWRRLILNDKEIARLDQISFENKDHSEFARASYEVRAMQNAVLGIRIRTYDIESHLEDAAYWFKVALGIKLFGSLVKFTPDPTPPIL